MTSSSASQPAGLHHAHAADESLHHPAPAAPTMASPSSTSIPSPLPSFCGASAPDATAEQVPSVHSGLKVEASDLSSPATAIGTATTPTPSATTATATATASASDLAPAASTSGSQPALSSILTASRPSTPSSNAVAATSSAIVESVNGNKPAAPSTSHNPSDQDQPMPDAPETIAQNLHDSALPNLPEIDQTQPTQEHQPQPDDAILQTPRRESTHSQTQFPMAATSNTMLAEHDAPSTPFNPGSMLFNPERQAYMMMALMTDQSLMPPAPTVVTPAQVTLPHPDFHNNTLAPAHTLREAAVDNGLQSFARIEFADSIFQMTTHEVMIGRDQRALNQARQDQKRSEQYERQVKKNQSMGLPPPPPPVTQDRSKFSKSYVSAEGGMLGPESSDDEDNVRVAKRRKTSTAGSSQHDDHHLEDNVISDRQYVGHTPGAAAVDLAALKPSPSYVPFIGIHSPGPDIASKTKAISRKHLSIRYNKETGVFEAIPKHKNGFFCEDVHYNTEKVVLKSGDRLQIKDVDFRFFINGVERGHTGAEDHTERKLKSAENPSRSGKQMSFDFEQSHGSGQVQDTSDELSDVEVSPPELSDFGDDYGDDPEAMEDPGAYEAGEDEDPAVKDEMGPTAEPMLPQLPRKRGPGRPPKNGIMSKREQRLLKKQEQEMAKKTLPQAPPVEPPIKRKVGRPRKHPLPEDAGDRPEKRKYKPRKPKTEDGAEGSEAERRAKEKKEKKARPKSPPLELKIGDYTQEQLQKPNKNYGVLIDETLTAAPDGLTLKQIYKRICLRYPWFYFHTETKGWESSVRHNLIGNEAFKKDETTNLWSRVPGVELDAGKKRKASSPDRALAAQGYGPYSFPYNAQPMGQNAPGYHPNQVPQGYQVPPYNGQPPAHVPRPPQQYGEQAALAPQPGAPTTVTAPQPQPQPQPAPLPGYGPPPAPARPQQVGPQPSSYSSPYTPRPPPQATAAVKSEEPHVPAPSPVAGPSTQPPPSLPANAIPRTVPGPAPATQGPSPAPVNASTATPPVNAAPKQLIEPRLLHAIVQLKNGLIGNLAKAKNPQAEAIVMSAINRCIGLKKDSVENEKLEAICMKGVSQVISGAMKNRSPTPGSSSAQPGPAHIFEPSILTHLNGFRDATVEAIGGKVGEARAEALALSVIDRVLGLAQASIIQPRTDGEAAAASERLEQSMMVRLRQILNPAQPSTSS